MNESEDKEFAAFVRASHEVSRSYRRLGDPPPPAHLDEQLMRHARAVLPPAHNTLKNFNASPQVRPGWFAPFALAASVLLSAAVLMAIAIDPQARNSIDGPVRLMHAMATRDERPMLTHPAPPARTPATDASTVVPRLIEPRRLYSSDPPGSHPNELRQALPPMPVEVIRRDPREWRARIQQLRLEGRSAQAELEWQEFLKMYPDQAPAGTGIPERVGPKPAPPERR